MASIPKKMKGVIVEKTGGAEVLRQRSDLPVPEPKEGEILVKNGYIGINYIDTYFRSGLYPTTLPTILGREAASTVVASRSLRFAPSDRVVFLGFATYAEYSVASGAQAAKIPETITSDVAAASLLQGLTALTLVREAYAVQRGDWILVHAAAGGVGLWLCQILDRLCGARVIATASTEEKRELAKKNGASFAVGYDGWVESVLGILEKESPGDGGVRAVFDGVGKNTFDGDLDVLARKGSLVSFGNASGPVPPFTIARLAVKNIKLTRPKLDNSVATAEEFDGYVDELWKFIADGKADLHIHEIYPLQDVARAHQDLEGRKTTGKLLLKP
ncbi:MAG: hypothetical protein M1825_003116 [Sarcosagium campestre]|nr:MAG: hypothetical protein M1825_003116 [Sarcosagium campestre]